MLLPLHVFIFVDMAPSRQHIPWTTQSAQSQPILHVTLHDTNTMSSSSGNPLSSSMGKIKFTSLWQSNYINFQFVCIIEIFFLIGLLNLLIGSIMTRKGRGRSKNLALQKALSANGSQQIKIIIPPDFNELVGK